jgi:hypothetical protein
LKPTVTKQSLQQPAEEVQWVQTHAAPNDAPSVFVRPEEEQAAENQQGRRRRSRWDDMAPQEVNVPAEGALLQTFLAQQQALQGALLDINQQAALELQFETIKAQAGGDLSIVAAWLAGQASGQAVQAGAGGRRRTKEVACRYFAEGRCSKGNDCPFSHDPAVIAIMPFEAKKRKVICRFFVTGRCTKGDSCVFLHEYTDQKAVQSAFSQTPCKFFAQGSCSRGAECFYAHVDPALHAAQLAAQQLEQQFLAQGMQAQQAQQAQQVQQMEQVVTAT